MNLQNNDSPTSLRVLLNGATEVTLSQAIDAFLRIEMLGKSSETKAWYRRRLEPLARDLGQERVLSGIMEIDLLDWYERLSARDKRYVGGSSRPEVQGGLSKDTLHGYVRACKRLFKWLHAKGILQADISADLQLPKLPRRGKKGISDAAAREILSASKGNPRDYALLKFIESTGIRRGGAAHLLLSDLDLENSDPRKRRRVTVHEKGDKTRTVVMSQSAMEAMEAWLAVRPCIADDHVFLGQRPGEAWRPLSESGISGVIRRYKESLGIPGKASPHQWRHRWCRKRLQDGMGIKQVSQLAGHESIGVTAQFYGEFAMEELQDAYDKFYRDPEEENGG